MLPVPCTETPVRFSRGAVSSPRTCLGSKENRKSLSRLTTMRSFRLSYLAETARGSASTFCNRVLTKAASSSSSNSAMHVSPGFAALIQSLGNLGTQLIQARQRPTSIMVPKNDRAIRTVQLVPCFTALAERMHVRRGMIIGIHSDAVASTAAEHCCHRRRCLKLRWRSRLDPALKAGPRVSLSLLRGRSSSPGTRS